MYHADLIGGVVARLAGIKALSWGIRNSGADLHKSSMSSRLFSWLCARLSGWVPAVIVSCAENAAQRHRLWGYRADRMLVIPNGYDLSRWHADAQARQAVREQWGVPADAPVIGSVARWNPLKDHANLLAAFALSVRQRTAMRCVLIGHGLEESNAELMRILDAHDLRDKRSEEHTSELQSLMRISYAVFCLKKKKKQNINIVSLLHITQPYCITSQQSL